MTSARFRFLVPSSDRKVTGGTRAYTFLEAQEERQWNRYGSLRTYRREALDSFLHAINGEGHAEEVLRLKGPALVKATKINLGFLHGALMPVMERDAGPLFSRLQVDGLSESAKARLFEELLVVCPLLGVLSPTDLVPEYRCPVGAQVPGFGSLHGYWKQHLPALLNRLCRKRRVVSFLSGRQQALWKPGAGVSELITIHFGRREGGVFRHDHAAHGGLAGSLIRHILTEDLRNPDDLAGWESDAGHRFSTRESTREDRRRSLYFVR